MATRPAGKKFRAGTLGELADDIYDEINAINAGAATWAAIVTASAAADTAIDFNAQDLTGVGAAAGIGLDVATLLQGTAVTALTDNSGGAADDSIAAITEVANAGSADTAATADAIADLAGKINEIRTILVAAGICA